MKATDDLFLLVKALSSSEKRYFKVFSRRHVKEGEVNKYEILYDAYDALPDEGPYDEAVLKASIKDAKISKNFADEKKNLHEMIMKALRSYSAGTSIDTQISELMIDEELYRSKRLNTLRRKTLERAIEMAGTYEKYEILLTLLMKRGYMNLELSHDTLREQADAIGIEYAQVLHKIQTITDLRNLNDWLFIQVRMYAAAGLPQNFWTAAEERINDPTFKNYAPGLCFRADRIYYSIWSLYYQLRGDAASSHEYQARLYALYDAYPHMAHADPVLYLITINNTLSSLLSIQDYAQMKVLLDKVEAIHPANEDEAGEAFQLLALYKMIYYHGTDQDEQTLKMIPFVMDGMKRHRRKVNKAREISLLYNIATAQMMLQRWDDVIDYTERIICDKSDARQDMKYGARLYQLIARHELGQIDLLTTQIRNTQRWIDSRSPLSDEYNSILKLLHTAVKEGAGYFRSLGSSVPAAVDEISAYPQARIWFYARALGVTMRAAAAQLATATA
ncbi:MAG: hypothetical protein JST90_19525 [Bacteroidetes bacterium]|nr:hypothetical protein [Bacteroidota bacterium]